jgi:hypothetical protein
LKRVGLYLFLVTASGMHKGNRGKTLVSQIKIVEELLRQTV